MVQILLFLVAGYKMFRVIFFNFPTFTYVGAIIGRGWTLGYTDVAVEIIYK